MRYKSSDTERSKAAHGNGVFTSQTPQRYNFRGVRRNGGATVRRCHYVVSTMPDDEVERRAVAPTQNESDLSTSSISCVVQRRRNLVIARTDCEALALP
jgi:hypothetical protein